MTYPSSLFQAPGAVLDKVITGLGKLVSWLALLMVLVTFLIVVLRYGFGLGWIALQESVVIMHGILFMLGIAFTFQHDAHVRVDVFYQNWSARQRARVDLLGTILFLIPICIYLFWASWPYVTDAWEIHEASGETGGIQGIYLYKTLLLLMPVTLLMQSLSYLFRQWIILTQDSSSETREH